MIVKQVTYKIVIPELPEHLRTLIQYSSPLDVNAEVIRHLTAVMRVAATSSNLKGTYIKALRDAVGYVTAAWVSQTSKKAATGRDNSLGTSKPGEEKRATLEEENEALRKKCRELSKKVARLQEGAHIDTSATKAGHSSHEKDNLSARVSALERQIGEIGPSIIKAMEERLGSQRTGGAPQRKPSEPAKARSYAAVASIPPSPPPPTFMEGRGNGEE